MIVMRNKIQLEVEGRNIERFIKRLIKEKIPLLKITQLNYKKIRILIYFDDYEKVNRLKTIYRITIVKTYGIVALKKRVKKHWFYLFSLAVAGVVLFILSHLIYQIEVIDLDKKVRDFLTTALKEEGVSPIQWKKSYDELQQVKKSILKKYQDEIEWMEIETVGTKYVVRVEMRKHTEKSKETEVRNIVASKDAIVRTVEATKGEIVKRNNDYVKAGDIIISGEIQLNEEVKNQVSATGTVYGEVWYEVEVEIPFQYYQVERTGRKNTVYVFEFLNHRFELLNQMPFQEKESEVTKIWEHLLLPIRFQKEKQEEVERTDEKLSKNDAIKKAVELGIQRMEEKLDEKEKIIDVKTLKTTQKKSKMVVDMFFTVYEDITAYAKIEEKENAQE